MKHHRFTGTLFAFAAAIVISVPAARADLDSRPEIAQLIETMVQNHGFDRPALEQLFRQVELRPDIIEAINRPAEAKPWFQYRPIFISDARISEGVAFWQEHRQDLERAQQQYGVPPEIIVAILGVETRFGRHRGRHRVMDALTTLMVDFPRRSEFFRRELEHYLLLTRDEGLDPLSITGSYAGAMGKPQFISSSYREYAVDFDGDGKRDLWDNTTDTIGSVANYFRRHQWQSGAPVASPAKADPENHTRIVQQGVKPHSPVADLIKQGVQPDQTLPGQDLAALIALDTGNGPEYWVTLNNFYVITRYNRSELYAMAVYQLGEAIRAQHDQQLARN